MALEQLLFPAWLQANVEGTEVHKDYILREVEEREDVARARCVGSATCIDSERFIFSLPHLSILSLGHLPTELKSEDCASQPDQHSAIRLFISSRPPKSLSACSGTLPHMFVEELFSAWVWDSGHRFRILCD